MKVTASHSHPLMTLGVFFGIVYFLTVMNGSTSAASVFPNPLSKYSFTEISNCKGMYDMRIYASLNSICDDCYNLFRDPEVHSLCRYDTFTIFYHLIWQVLEPWIYPNLLLNRKNCFTSKYFKGCLEVLLIKDVKQLEEITKNISIIHPMGTDTKWFRDYSDTSRTTVSSRWFWGIQIATGFFTSTNQNKCLCVVNAWLVEHTDYLFMIILIT